MISMTDIFETDISKLKQLTLRSQSQVVMKHQANDESIKRELNRRTLMKFGLLCRKLNIDPLHPKSIHVVLLLFSKIKDKRKLMEGFLTHPCCESLKKINLDWNAVDDESVNINEVFCAMSDWILILRYLTPNVTVELSDSMMKDPLFVRLRQSWNVGGLETNYPSDISRLMTAFIFMAPYNLSASKMLERLLAGESDVCRDLEFRCLRMTNHFIDVSVDEKESIMNMLQIVPCMVTKSNFASDMKFVLSREECTAQMNATIPKKTRLQMRHVSKIASQTNHSEYKESFDTWLGQQKFTVTMSRHLQLLLYFIQVQTIDIPRQSYSQHFTDTMMARVQHINVQSIDANAVISVIKSLRLYHHNVKDLLDFRSTCLTGFNQKIRNSLSLAQILQLYVSSFQHESILQTCWKSIVPVWTHTTATAVQRFTATHKFDYQPVIDSVVMCQVHDMV
tara:strand:+ start:872 stop:2224 length:1353 start_codon:yes stop_codon:yes gene_type:complete